MSSKEIESGYSSVVTVNRINGNVSVRTPSGSSQELPKVFVFDVVFDVDSKQVRIFYKVIFELREIIKLNTLFKIKY